MASHRMSVMTYGQRIPFKSATGPVGRGLKVVCSIAKAMTNNPSKHDKAVSLSQRGRPGRDS